MFRIQLVTGPDGDRRYHHLLVNVDKKRLWECYNKGTEIVGFDLTDEVCTAEHETYIEYAKIFLLQKHGCTILGMEKVKPDDLDEEGYDSGGEHGFQISGKDFSRIWMFIANLGSLSLYGTEIEHEPATDEDTLYIGAEGISF